MLNKRYLGQLKKEILSYAEKRRETIKSCGDALYSSKKAIFAMHKDRMEDADDYLKKAETIFVELNKKFKKDPQIFEEGSYRAALEEFVEASIFCQFLNNKIIGEIPNLNVDADVYIGGICDVPGEMLRYAIKSATNRNFEMVKKCEQAAEEIIGELIDMDLTGYSRQKFDQAKQALQKLEQVAYETSLRV
ncbi:MAG: hypothetical protein WC430_01095 [Patescibacteria group bacterium]